MSATLTDINLAFIQARCTENSFSRGQSYYGGGAVQQRQRHANGIETRVAGSRMYWVTVRPSAQGLHAICTCPYDLGGDCKHIVATLLAWLHEPDSFRTANELQLALAARSHAELVQLLLEMSTVYPHLVDEFALLGGAATFDPETAVHEIFRDMDPRGGREIGIEEAVARMERVARQAARLAKEGQGVLARQTYYALTRRCVHFCIAFGAQDFFPPNIPYDFTEAYLDLALEQRQEHAAAIEAEVDAMLQGDWAPEMLGIDELLYELLYFDDELSDDEEEDD